MIKDANMSQQTQNDQGFDSPFDHEEAGVLDDTRDHLVLGGGSVGTINMAAELLTAPLGFDLKPVGDRETARVV